MLDDAALRTAISAGGDSFVEFKAVKAAGFKIDVRDLAKAIAALANAQGGHVLIGVEDDGSVSGIGSAQDADALMRQVVQACQDLIEPALSCPVRRHRLDDQTILVVEVPEFGLGRPYQVERKFYIRRANLSAPASRDELRRLLESVDFHHDEQPVPGTGYDDLEPAAVAGYMAAVQLDDPPGGDLRLFLRDAHCLTADGVATVSGLVCFGRDPQRHLLDARISAVRFPGHTMGPDMLDRAEIGGRLDQQLDAALAFLGRHVPAPASIQGVERREGGLPAKVQRELIVNALIHRDYRPASQIRLFVFDDRIECVNPGELLNKLTLDGIRRGGISQKRNPVIASLFNRLRRAECYGYGIPEMIAALRKQGLPDPEFVVGDGHFRMVLRWQHDDD